MAAQLSSYAFIECRVGNVGVEGRVGTKRARGPNGMYRNYGLGSGFYLSSSIPLYYLSTYPYP
jgi:hypothetical protein